MVFEKQTTQSIETLAYTAGYMDGDGGISLYASKDKKHSHNYRIRLMVIIASVNEDILQWLKLQYGGKVVRHKRYNIRQKPLYQWQIRSDYAMCFLVLVLPYLILKRPQAELAISFQGRRVKYLRKSDDDWNLDIADRERMLKLNRITGRYHAIKVVLLPTR